MKINELQNDIKNSLLKLSGILNTPDLNEFETVNHFLVYVNNKLLNAKSCLRETKKMLGD